MAQRICLDGSDWLVQGWVPYEWDLIGPVHITTGNLDLREVMHGETAQIPATVPGCVQADLLAAGIIAAPYQDYNSRLCEWVKDRMWTYQRGFTVPADAKGSRVRLHFHGIDYSARIFVNGELAGRHEGMFLPATFDVTNKVKFGSENILQVAVDPAPACVAQVGKTSEVCHLKARFAYKWDFTTRLVPLGLWDSVFLRITGPAAIDEFFVHAVAGDKTATARVQCIVDGAPGARLRAQVQLSLAGQEAGSGQFDFELTAGVNRLCWPVKIDSPQLWWPHGMGEQPIYTAAIRITDAGGRVLDESSTTFGIRKIQMLPNEGAPPSARPYTLAVNGKKVFLKGFNWVPIEQMYGTTTEEKYRWMIRLARSANANMLRVWGGGLIEKELFYDLCDQAGMLLWQEMPQSSSGLDNEPARDDAFVADVEKLARSVIRRRGGHPCLVFFGGGNELTAAGLAPLDETHPALAAIGRAVAQEHPNLVFVPTSPLGPSFDMQVANVGKGVHHDIHGPWKYLGVKFHYEYFNANDCLFHAETGADGCTSTRSMLRFARKELLWPPEASNRFWCHHAGWWIQGQALRRLFGPIDDLETFVKASQAMQADSVRYAIESNRRRKWQCSATLLWQLSEPWPNLSATSSVDYYGEPKLAYYFVSRAFQPVHVSLRHNGVAVQPGANFAADFFAHNALEQSADARVEWRIVNPAGRTLANGHWDGCLPTSAALGAGSINWPAPADLAEPFFVILDLTSPLGDTRNTYFFCPDGEPPLAPLLALPRTTLELGVVPPSSVLAWGCGQPGGMASPVLRGGHGSSATSTGAAAAAKPLSPCGRGWPQGPGEGTPGTREQCSTAHPVGRAHLHAGTAPTTLTVTVRNTGPAVAWLVNVSLADPIGCTAEQSAQPPRAICLDNGMTLLPGETREFHLEFETPPREQPRISVTAWNAG